MPVRPWQLVSRALGAAPLVSADIAGRTPLRVERYIFHARQRQLPALPVPSLAVHLGGARVSGVHARGEMAHYVPSYAALVPAGCPSAWRLHGAVDAAIFYFTSPDVPPVRRLVKAAGATEVSAFVDALVSAAAAQLVGELGRGPAADLAFVRRLAGVVVDQLERVLRGRAGQALAPAPQQLGRLKQVLEWLHGHLGATVTNAALAERAGLSESHFRHMFVAAMGMPPSRYVRQKRIERARELLAGTTLPIARVADECGFVSQSYLTTCFRAAYGMTPARYRRAAA